MIHMIGILGNPAFLVILLLGLTISTLRFLLHWLLAERQTTNPPTKAGKPTSKAKPRDSRKTAKASKTSSIYDYRPKP